MEDTRVEVMIGARDLSQQCNVTLVHVSNLGATLLRYEIDPILH